MDKTTKEELVKLTEQSKVELKERREKRLAAAKERRELAALRREERQAREVERLTKHWTNKVKNRLVARAKAGKNCLKVYLGQKSVVTRQVAETLAKEFVDFNPVLGVKNKTHYSYDYYSAWPYTVKYRTVRFTW